MKAYSAHLIDTSQERAANKQVFSCLVTSADAAYVRYTWYDEVYVYIPAGRLMLLFFLFWILFRLFLRNPSARQPGPSSRSKQE